LALFARHRAGFSHGCIPLFQQGSTVLHTF
jgi:hypothetical protein